MNFDMFYNGSMYISPWWRIILQPIKQRLPIFSQIFVEISNIIERTKKSLKLSFFCDQIRKFFSKLDGPINGTNFSFGNIKTKESDLGLEKLNLFGRNNKTTMFNGVQEGIKMFSMFFNRFGERSKYHQYKQ
jgi:hypothetical protein